MTFRKYIFIWALCMILPLGVHAQMKRDVQLQEVLVKAKKTKYKRKDNPAVELMKRVIAAKKQTKLETNDYYQYRTYEKLTISLNDLSEHAVDSGVFAKKPYLKKQIEKNPVTGKNTLPIITDEKIFKTYYQKDPKKERVLVEAEQSKGLNSIVEIGDMFKQLAQDIFSEVDIYDNRVRLFRHHVTSPIADDAIGFYRYYLLDTLKVDKDSCIHVAFLPNNLLDIGFRGDLYVVKDSTLHVKKVHLQLPPGNGINFVRMMDIEQNYTKIEDGQWVLTTNDMMLEMSIVGKLGQFLIKRTSRRTDYSFDEIGKKTFRGKAKEITDPYAQMRTKEYWAENRPVPLTHGERDMDEFVKGLKSTKHFGWALVALQTVLENYIETTKKDNPSKVDIGPILSFISSNDIDGFRLRPAFMTTGNLSHHFFFKGYYAHGFKSKNNYYNATFTYAINRKVYLPNEFPRRNVVLASTYDIGSASDKFSMLDKDNVFSSFRWTEDNKRYIYNRQTVTFDYETDWGFEVSTGFNFEKKTAVGNLYYNHMGEDRSSYKDWLNHGSIRTTEWNVELTYTPNQHYMNTKMKRYPVNHEAPIYRLRHTIGINGFMGGQYNYNVTEASFSKRVWIKNCGVIQVYLKGGIQWNKVPYPLLIAPAANLSRIHQRETFNLVTDMEFLNDRYVSLMTEWDLQGKILNRIPGLRSCKWREHFGFNMLWGALSDKNNPTLEVNKNDPYMMELPTGTSKMNGNEPYFEAFFGFHNVLKFFRLDYVRRINYGKANSTMNAFRIGFSVSF